MLSARSDPGFSSVKRICAALGITPNDLAGLGGTERETWPTLDTVLAWWHGTGGILDPDDPLCAYMDIYAPPEPGADLPRPCRVGEKSASCLSLGLPTPEALHRFQSSGPAELAAAHLRAQSEAMTGRPVLLLQEVPAQPGHDPQTLIRLLLPVTDRSGMAFILDYARSVGTHSGEDGDGG